MIFFSALVLIIPATILASFLLLPKQFANRNANRLSVVVTRVVGLQAILSALFAGALAFGWLSDFSVPLIPPGSFASGVPEVITDGAEASGLSSGGAAPSRVASARSVLSLSVYFDGISGLMFSLVSFVGWIICSYSIRYLDGEPNQGQYFRWTGFTIGAVSFMVLSGNLLMFIIAWIATSLGLHQLLLFYGHRPAAKRAAWTKFAISRLGDVALLWAMALIFIEFRTLEFSELFKTIAASGGSAISPSINVAGMLLVLGAVTKSAQFPFHTWLPQTMETPTPVSALMHAGIVNAGGYLVIRMSPMIVLTPTALTLLAVVGALTTLFATVVMLTQTSVKRSLAYSTIAQMGFMILQCGLGAFSAAMLHILAHSLYKAYAFLSSGSVLAQPTQVGDRRNAQEFPAGWKLASVVVIVPGFVWLAMLLFGVSPMAKPGGLLLAGVLSLALISWLTQVLRTGDRLVLLRSLAVCGGLSLIYASTYAGVDRIVASGLPVTRVSLPMPWYWVNLALLAAVVLASFGCLFALTLMLNRKQRPQWLDTLYVHASNEFYTDSWTRRMLGQTFRRSARFFWPLQDQGLPRPVSSALEN